MKRLFTRAVSLLAVAVLTIATGALAQLGSDSDAAKAKPPIAHLTVAKSLGFGTVKAIAIKPIMLTNTGAIEANVTVTGPSQPSPFAVIAGGGSYSLGPGQAQVISVQFLPNAKGPVKQEITIQCPNCSPASDSNLTIHISGNASGAIANNALPFSVTRINAPVASITVCATGTSNCRTLDGIAVDTGAPGLRLFGSQLSGLGITPNTDGGSEIGECAFFGYLTVSASVWGAVSTVDVKIAGEPTITVPIQVIDDINAFVPPPSACTQGTLISSPSVLGYNGILGVSQAANDLPKGYGYDYFDCSVQDCSLLSNPPNEDAVLNPVPLFPVDNNGVVVSLPAIADHGQKTSNGTLYFGIGTEGNNQPGQVTTYRLNSDTTSLEYLGLNTVYQGITAPGFFDSGTSGYTFNSSIRRCSNGYWDCPAKTLSESATNESVDGSVSGIVNFRVANFDNAFNSNKGAFNNVGSTFDGGTTYDAFVWGLPFFFGRIVYLGVDGTSVATRHRALHSVLRV